ncbi:MAG: hypothetical protein ACRBB2_00725 [Nitrosopumilus sp.]
MKSKLVITPIVVVLAIELFFVYIRANGYSIYDTEFYIEEITQEESDKYLSETSGQIPLVLETLELLKEQPKVMQLFDKFSQQYLIAKTINDEEYKVKNHLSDSEARELFDWIRKNNLNQFVYDDRYYRFLHWIS